MPTPVKDLVGAYESKRSSSTNVPPPRPARFLRHPAGRDSAPAASAADENHEEGPMNPFEDAVGGMDIGQANSRADVGEPSIRSSTVQRVFYSPDAANSEEMRNLALINASQTQVTSFPGSKSSRSSVVTTRDLRREGNSTPLKPQNEFDKSELSNTLLIMTPTSDITRVSSRRLDPKLSHSAYSPVLYHDTHDNDYLTNSPKDHRSIFTPLKNMSSSTTYIPLVDRSKEVQPSPNHLLKRQNMSSGSDKHQPIPATEIFSRKAVPLYLPHLDELLAGIPQAEFDANLIISPSDSHSVKGKGSSKFKQGIFKPLHKLNGKTLDELHHNSSPPSFLTDKNSILSSIVTGVIGVAGSSAIASYYSLQGVYDGVQIFALVLSSVVPKSSIPISERWRELFLSTIPNVLALNIPTKLTQSLIFLAIFMVICGLLLYKFYTITRAYAPSTFREGLQARQPPSSWKIIAISFILTVLYLPLSTIAVHGVLWSSDFWVVANPYTNGTKSSENLAPLGPSDVWRDPLDFCYTTTMRRDEVNYAPVIVAMSAITFIFMTLWFPIRLMQTIRQSLPHVDPYTELGRKRSRPEMELEYQRLLERDQSPFAFLYKDFRRAWGEYKSVYLWAKLSALLIVAILSPDNCVFRNVKRDTVDIVRQSVLTVSMLVWFLIQCFLVPFLDPVSNASEWTSRLNYLLTSSLGLLVALNAPGGHIFNGVLLYIVYAITYGLDFYFAIIGTSFMRRIVKKLFKRVDFSIDIFSPKLDLTANSPHIRRRIWQESIGTLVLTEEISKIPAGHKIKYSEPEDFEWPPYLLDFHGTPGERHVENLKILREEGLKKYARAMSMTSGPDAKLYSFLEGRIQRHFVGPDCYWKPLDKDPNHGCPADFFGNAWWIPFPPTLVIRYDRGGHAVLDSIHEFEHYVFQNESPHIHRLRHIRLALRCLDHQIVVWPYTHIQPIGSRTWFTGRRYSMQSAIHFRSCLFTIKHRGIQFWRDLPLGSGFDIELVYNKEVCLDSDGIGLDDHLDVTQTLARFLQLNQHIIQSRLPKIEEMLQEYRRECRKVAKAKNKVLSYGFLTRVYNWPLKPDEVVSTVDTHEQDLRVRDIFASNTDAVEAASQRINFASRSEVTVWWFLFWDDFWRRNHDTEPSLSKFEADFNPHYASSIAYRPLPRPALETFLVQRGLLNPKSRWRQTIHHGLLNKVYFRLNQIAFHNTDRGILIHLGDGEEEMDLNDLDLTTHVRSSSMGTGGGTDLDDAEIRIRPAFKWEDVFDDAIHHGGRPKWQYLHWRRWRGMLAVWFGITPLNRRRLRTSGIALDVALDGMGRYVVLERTRQ
ncbi:hypothetical protein FRC16_011205 [Serendipita sp. 398]|nr:hypothetical protein FRC16_011205 [Serendipita sp. 398]